MDEWILNTMNIETFECNTESWVGEAISKGMSRHQNSTCLNCGKIGHLRRDYRQGIPRNNVSSGNDKNRRSQSSDYVEDVAKAEIGPMNADQQQTDKATRYHQETI